MFIVVFSWFLLSVLIGVMAVNKGRSGVGFMLLAMLFSPLIGFIAVVLTNPNVKVVENARLASGTNKKCPHCAEIIKQEAVVCRFCGRDMPQAVTTPERVLAESTTPASSADRDSLTEEFSITFDGRQYHYKQYRYDKLQDAVNYARRERTEQTI